ncbi:MAG: peptidase M20 [Phenylobacterium zucineum]|nr:MAG: peptidase M20 [Phenylobacterium zucineum]
MQVELKLLSGLALAVQVFALTPSAAHAAEDAKLARYRKTYREMIETDSSAATGSCTAVAEKVQARLLAAGYPRAAVEVSIPEGFPKDGALLARLDGTDPKAPAVLLLAHIDVVNANPADWKRDPFKLVEEDGYFFGRGAIDDKAMASNLVDALVRYKEEGFRPRHTLKLALTCGEESGGRVKGVKWLLEHRPETLKAAFAINEGGSGYLDAAGKPTVFGVEAGQKVYQDFKLVVTSPGAHSSRPGKDNAITRMSAALVRLGAYQFPVQLNDVAKGFFGRSAALHEGQVRQDMAAIGAGAADAAAIARIADADPTWNARLRTTCSSTMIDGGHARNALAQHVEVNVNCRIVPGPSIEEIRAAIVTALADPSVEVTTNSPPPPPPVPTPLTREIMGPIETVAARLWPGTPVIPALSTGATDGRFLTAAGIPTYGVTGMFVDPDGNGVHGLDERVRVSSLYKSRDFLYQLIKLYGMGR